LKAHLTSRDSQKRETRGSLWTTQRTLSEATDRILTLETDLLAKDQCIESLRHRMTEEPRLRAGVTRELRTQRGEQDGLGVLEVSSAERIAEAERKTAYAVERTEDHERDAASAKETVATLRRELNEAKLGWSRARGGLGRKRKGSSCRGRAPEDQSHRR
jgi:hypothetical protein